MLVIVLVLMLVLVLVLVLVLFQGTLRTMAGGPLVYTSFGREQNSLLFLCRFWRLLVIREPPSDSDGETPRRINGVVQSPQHLWDVGCRIYMTAVPDVFREWRTEAKWRADWRGVLYLGYQGDDADYDPGHEEGLWLSMQPVCLCRRTPFMISSLHVHVI